MQIRDRKHAKGGEKARENVRGKSKRKTVEERVEKAPD